MGRVRAQRVALRPGGAGSPTERVEVMEPPAARGLKQHPGKENRKNSKKQLENGAWTQGMDTGQAGSQNGRAVERKGSVGWRF